MLHGAQTKLLGHQRLIFLTPACVFGIGFGNMLARLLAEVVVFALVLEGFLLESLLLYRFKMLTPRPPTPASAAVRLALTSVDHAGEQQQQQ